MKNTLITGALYCDLTAFVDRLPKGNEDIQAEEYESRAGGLGFLCAYVFQHMNFPYVLLNMQGSGVHADAARSDAEKKGVTVSQNTEDMAGSRCVLIDPKGETRQFLVPGCEYDFSYVSAEDTDPEETDSVIVTDEFFLDEGYGELVEFLQDLERPVSFVTSGILNLAKEGDIQDAVNALVKLSKILWVKEEDLPVILGKEEYDSEEELKNLAGSDRTLIVERFDGSLFGYENETFFKNEEKDGGFMRTASFLAGIRAGLDTETALQYAQEFSTNRIEKNPESGYYLLKKEESFEFEKQKLAGLIKKKWNIGA